MSAPIPISLPSQVRPDCPSRDLMWQVIQGETGHETTSRVIEHCGLCPNCAERWREMCELSMELSDAVGTRPRSLSSAPPCPAEERTPLPFSTTFEHHQSSQDPGMDKNVKLLILAFAVLALLALLV